MYDLWYRIFCLTTNTSLQRLAAKDLDDWEQKRVERLKGEPDGVI